MSLLVNGELAHHVSALDRGMMYGQSVFETVAILNGRACLLEKHLQRLKKGADRLNIVYDETLLSSEILRFIEETANAVLRITLTMGQGGRGYQNPAKSQSTRVLSLHDLPAYSKSLWQEGIELGLVDIRLSHQPVLAGIKHGNRLEQVIARSQWQQSWNEALVMDVDDNVVEGTQSNVFIVKNNSLITPCLKQAGVEGVMRESIIEIAQELDINCQISSLSLDDIEQADAIFLSNSIIGIWPVKSFNSISFKNLTLAHKLLKIIKKNEFISTF